MTQVNSSLECKLKIPALSLGNLLELIEQNEGVVVENLDGPVYITIQIEARLDWNVAINDSTDFKVPAYYLPVERFGLNEEASKILEKALAILKESVIDSDDSHINLRKLVCFLERLEKLSSSPKVKTADPIKSLDFYQVKFAINKLIEEVKKRLNQATISWEYKDKNSMTKYYYDRKLSDLVGGKKLLEQAIEQAIGLDVFEYIRNNQEETKFTLNEKTRVYDNQKYQEPFIICLSPNGAGKRTAAFHFAMQMLSLDTVEECDNIIVIDDMERLMSLLNYLKAQNLLEKVSAIVINSAPPYFDKPNFEQFQLMMKYGIYNRGMTNYGLDYDRGCVDDIEGIIRLLKGEFEELPKPCVLCDSSDVLKKYNPEFCIAVPISVPEIYDKKLGQAQKTLKRN